MSKSIQQIYNFSIINLQSIDTHESKAKIQAGGPKPAIIVMNRENAFSRIFWSGWTRSQSPCIRRQSGGRKEAIDTPSMAVGFVVLKWITFKMILCLYACECFLLWLSPGTLLPILSYNIFLYNLSEPGACYVVRYENSENVNNSLNALPVTTFI